MKAKRVAQYPVGLRPRGKFLLTAYIVWFAMALVGCGSGKQHAPFIQPSSADSGGGAASDAGPGDAATGSLGDAGPKPGEDASTGPEGDAGAETFGVFRNYVFVTSQDYDANFGGLEQADGICADLAAAAGLAGEYVAWLSTSTANACDRIPESAEGWARVDGKPFAKSRADLLEGRILFPPRIDENGKDVGTKDLIFVFTGTDYNGALWVGGSYNHCADWTTTNPSMIFRGGVPSGGTLAWTAGNGTTCDIKGRLYCFGVDNAVEENADFAKGRLAFISRNAFKVKKSLKDADEMCAYEASEIGLAGSFKALLSTKSQSAADRFKDGDPWVRPDGVPVVEKAADLLAGKSLLAPINVDLQRGYYGSTAVWSRAAGIDVTSESLHPNCSDWTSTSGDGVTGMACYTSDGYFYDSTLSCDFEDAHLYCLQE